MKILFYIDQENFNLSKLRKYFGAEDEITIFSTSYFQKEKWQDSYPIITYEDVGLCSQHGAFDGLMPVSYKITYDIIEILSSGLNIDEARRKVLNSIPSKLHRVVSEALHAEKIISSLLVAINPDSVYSTAPNDKLFELHNGRIDGKTNFGATILKKYCRINEISYNVLNKFPLNRKEFYLNYVKNKVKVFVYSIYYQLVPHRLRVITSNVDDNIQQKPVIFIYLYGYMFQRNQMIWEFFNQDQDKYYIFITDKLSSKDRARFDEYKNLNFIHVEGRQPYIKNRGKQHKTEIENLISDDLDVDILPFSLSIIANYISHYIFGYYDAYIKNNDYFSSFLDKFKPVTAIFPSYWEVQPSLLINDCNATGIETIAIQAGIHPKGTTEISLTKHLFIYGDWDLKILERSEYNFSNLQKIGWPLGELYNKRIPAFRQHSHNPKKIVFLLSIAGAWQYFNHFPEDAIIGVLIRTAKHFPELSFLIRSHTGNNIKNFQKLLDKFGLKNIDLNITGALEDVLENADFVFTHPTTAGFEALSLNIPTFGLNLYSNSNISPFTLLGAEFCANNEDELIRIINKLMKREKQYLNKYELAKEKLLKIMFKSPFEYDLICNIYEAKLEYEN